MNLPNLSNFLLLSLYDIYLREAIIKINKASRQFSNKRHIIIFINKCLLIFIYKEVTDPTYVQ